VAAVDTFAALGYRQIKIYSSVDTSLVRLIARRAHEHGLRVGGHVPAFMSAEQAIHQGFDEVNHLNYLFLDLWADSIGDTRTLVRVTAVGDRAAGVDLSSAPVRRLVALLRERRTVIDPTLNVFERIYRGRKGVPYPGYEDAAGRVPPQTRLEFLAGGLPADAEKRALYGRSFVRMLELARLLRDAGVTLVAGSDGQPGFAFPRELELWAQAGIPPAEVLRTATLGAATVMGMERDFGTVSAGKVADLVVLGGNPLERMGDVRRVELVIKGGRVYRADALRRAMGFADPVSPAAPQPPR
jgi:imidazolonepropionase-like amidohydrolase